LALVFNCIDRFLSDISNLTKKPREGYSSVKEDIRNLFSGLTFDAIFSLQCIRQIGKSKLIKVRLPISSSSIGSRGGFRLIFTANPNNKHVTLCHIYPKRGKYGKSDMSPNEVAKILKELVDETSTNTLRQIDFLMEK
jgi:mRNA-degrading endonuclease RelE of RelBE toxin-antitoxin system